MKTKTILACLLALATVNISSAQLSSLSSCSSLIIGGEEKLDGKCGCPTGKVPAPYEGNFQKLQCVSESEYKAYEDAYVKKEIEKVQTKNRENLEIFCKKTLTGGYLDSSDKCICPVGKIAQVISEKDETFACVENSSDIEKFKVEIYKILDGYIKENPSYKNIINKEEVVSKILNDINKYQDKSVTQVVEELYGIHILQPSPTPQKTTPIKKVVNQFPDTDNQKVVPKDMSATNNTLSEKTKHDKKASFIESDEPKETFFERVKKWLIELFK